MFKVIVVDAALVFCDIEGWAGIYCIVWVNCLEEVYDWNWDPIDVCSLMWNVLEEPDCGERWGVLWVELSDGRGGGSYFRCMVCCIWGGCVATVFDIDNVKGSSWLQRLVVFSVTLWIGTWKALESVIVGVLSGFIRVFCKDSVVSSVSCDGCCGDVGWWLITLSSSCRVSVVACVVCDGCRGVVGWWWIMFSSSSKFSCNRFVLKGDLWTVVI